MDRHGPGIRLPLRRGSDVRSAFSWQLRSFLGAIALLVLTQLASLSLGMTIVLDRYESSQLAALEEQAREILLAGGQAAALRSDHEGPFFVFSADRNLVYSNRGRGAAIAESEYRPVRYEGTVIGYFFADDVRFLSARSNRVLFASTGLLLVASLAIGTGIALLFARRSARTVSEAVGLLSSDLGFLSHHEPVPTRSFPVTELTGISEHLGAVGQVLAAQEEYKRRWMQDLAHDLRTPIAGLRSQLEAMADGALPAEPARMERLLGEVSRLEAMVESVSVLQRIEESPEIPEEHFLSTNLTDALRRTFGAARPEADDHLEILDPGLPLRGDRSLLQRALANIVHNAVVHGGAGVRVRVEVVRSENATQISIHNDGPSIPEDQLPRIFQRFYRGEGARRAPGTGLGLNIAEQAVRLHGGTIRVENTPPRGVLFRLYLPDRPSRAD